MPEAVQLAVVRLASMVAWIGEHPGVSVDELATHFHRTRRQVRRDIDYLASVGDSMPGASFEIDWGLYEEEERVSLRSTMGASAPLRFSEAEAHALLIGLSAIAPLLGPDLADRGARRLRAGRPGCLARGRGSRFGPAAVCFGRRREAA